jgi:membrane-associated protease RseP (regulator of RpoE activity)
MSPAVVAPPEVATEPPGDPLIPPQARAETLLRLGALVVGVVLFSALLASTAGWAWVAVVWSVMLIIMLHELGHYSTAKWSGMKATEFFVGFGPRLWSIRRGETEYGVKAFPLGGYVKILGMTSMEELDPSDEPRSFVNQSTSKRVLVASAGSIVHFLLALFLAIGALWFIGWPHNGPHEQLTSLTVLSSGSTPAQLAGFHLGDEFLTVDGAPATQTAIDDAILGSKGKPQTFVILRDHHRLTIVATPAPTPAGLQVQNGSHYFLGIAFAPPVTHTPTSFLGAITGSARLIGQVTAGTGAAFVHAFSPSGLTSLAHQDFNSKAAAQARASGSSTVSMIGAFELAADAFKAGPLQFIGLLISLNISLGILNMLPMLPLDGGHVAIALYERSRTRRGMARYRADVKKLLPVAYAFMGFLLLFVVGKMYLDIAHGVRNPFG